MLASDARSGRRRRTSWSRSANEHGGSDNITVVVVDVLVGEDDHPDALGDHAPRGPVRAARSSSPTGPGAGRRPALGSPADRTPWPRAPSWASPESTGTLSGDGPRSWRVLPGQHPGGAGGPGDRALGWLTPAPSRRPRLRPTRAAGSAAAAWGSQRRITLRVVLFILLVAAIPVGAFFAIRWYAYDNWFLSVQDNEIVIQQGHPGGVLWFHPRVVDRTGVTTSQCLPAGWPRSAPACRSPRWRPPRLRRQPRTTSTPSVAEGGRRRHQSSAAPGVTTHHHGVPRHRGDAASSVPPATAATTTTTRIDGDRHRPRPPP